VQTASSTTSRTRELFASHGLRSTDQRITLYEALSACRSHPTADELFRMVQSAAFHLSLATVYNTLETFCEVGLCRRLATTAGAVRYDADMSEHLHVRIQPSGEIRDVPCHLSRKLLESIPPDALAEIEQTLGVKIDGVAVQLIAKASDPGAAVSRGQA
jgi:Fe2+ or Zn2+ uptake regulation protein